MHLKYKIVKIDERRVYVDLLVADRDKGSLAPFIRVGQLDLTHSDWATFRSNLPINYTVED